MTMQSEGPGPEHVLVSHALCPYVQRAAIVLAEKGVAFTRRDVDLSLKPAWFTALSPLGKTPVLLAGGQALFESAVICEYLEDTRGPRLHPADALLRARHRAWMEFGSAMLNTIAGFYNAVDDAALRARRDELVGRLAQLEPQLAAGGPYFAGVCFSIVDAVFAPVFRYFDAFEQAGLESFMGGLPRVQAWRAALAARPSVRQAVAPAYPQALLQFLRARGSALSHRMVA
jgi:glutathione S-transferase